ncbi:MAG: hypothetical protein HS111_33060 [Kofleriaceae bacterium]|nr:hypothetical protein [Kofleriaceae bacterium]
MSPGWPSGCDARRIAFVAPAAAVALCAAAAHHPAAADDARDLFGLDAPADAPATCADARDLPGPVDDARPPAAWRTRLRATYLLRLPLAAADLDAAAGLVVGAGRDDGGLYYAGATSADNRWLVDGAAVDSPRLGNLGLRVPLAFVDEVTVTTGGFSARDRAAVGAVIEARLREGGDDHRATASAWLAPARRAAHRAGARSCAASTARSRAASPISARSTWRSSATGDAPRRRRAPVVLAGVAPPRAADASLVRRHAWRRADADGDLRPDRRPDGLLVHDPLGTAHRDALAWSVPAMLRLGARAAHHDLAATALVTAAGDTRWRVTAEEDAAGVDRRDLDASLSATWRGTWPRTRARVVASWLRAGRVESPRTAGGLAPDLGLAYIPPAEATTTGADRAVRAGCTDQVADDPYPGFVNCPFPTGYYHVGGVGQLGDVIQDRPGVVAELERAIGDHTITAGVSGEDARVVLRTRYSGGYLRRQLGPEAYVDYRLVRVGSGPGLDDACGDVACDWLDEHERTIRTRHVAAWLADTWRPGAAIAVEYGARAEASQIGESVRVRDLLPRLGAAWDFLGGGRSRAFVGWGRYAAVLPAGAGERVFAGPTVYQQATFGPTMTHALAASGDVPIAPDLRGVRVDEALAGVEVGAADVARLGVVARHRHLGRGLETVGGVLTVVGAEPGQAAATRELIEVGVTGETSPAAAVTVRAGYAWSRLRGNWAGPHDPVDGFGLYLSSALDDGAINATGPLPNDQPHRFFAEVTGRGRKAGFDLELGLRAAATSGRPRSVRTIAGQSFLLPRGAAGRLPTVAQTSARLAARRGRLTVGLDVLNVFDRRGTVAVDEVHVIDALLPIDGGDAGDLIFAKDNVFESEPARVNRRRGAPSRFQAPLTAVLGVRVEL